MQKVTPETAIILKARHEANMFGEMGERNLILSAQLIIADLKLLSGLKLPTGDAFSRMAELLAESLKEDYPFFTVPLVKIAIKKNVSVLTSGKEKSYGRDLSVSDFHQVMDAYLKVIQDADMEINEILNKEIEEKILSEDEKQNLIRESIQEIYEGQKIEGTYVVFNQLLRDNLISSSSLDRHGWQALQQVKEKHLTLLQSIPIEKASIENDRSAPFKAALFDRDKIQAKYKLILELEDDIKAEVATQYLKWCKSNNVEKIYTK